MGALDTAVRSGKALYAGISSYSPERTREAYAILRSMGTPLLIHQPSYSMINRWIEGGLLDILEELGRRLHRVLAAGAGRADHQVPERRPAGSRASRNGSLSQDQLSERTLAHVRALNEIAASRGQTLAQMAISWVLRDERMTSALIGASSAWPSSRRTWPPRRKTSFTAEEIEAIDKDAVEAGINIWAASSGASAASWSRCGRLSACPCGWPFRRLGCPGTAAHSHSLA